MRALCVLSLIACWSIALISTKPINESADREEYKPLNKTEIAKMIEELQLLEKLANETYYSSDPTTKDTYLSKDPEADETIDPTREETKKANGETGEDEGFMVEDEEEEDEATVDRPTESQPLNFLRYPKHEPDYKAYPRFAILRNGYVHHMNFNF
ncbi:uncharacterized protein LOC128259706 [Drosophila gunungcola]|uniref:uncharacterized protein LOC128259706 n=1 Tax=Drosophila gunungcola TaxID=103775 RepID=UPI0022E634CF|nr:uncharacterized protein LOC128259706 [Drosophila gunungcola]